MQQVMWLYVLDVRRKVFGLWVPQTQSNHEKTIKQITVKGITLNSYEYPAH